MGPARLECWTAGQHSQKRGGWHLIEHKVQQFEGCRVRPVQVFQDKEYRLTFSKLAQTQHLNHEPQTAWNTLPINELRHGDLLGYRERRFGVS